MNLPKARRGMHNIESQASERDSVASADSRNRCALSLHACYEVSESLRIGAACGEIDTLYGKHLQNPHKPCHMVGIGMGERDADHVLDAH